MRSGEVVVRGGRLPAMRLGATRVAVRALVGGLLGFCGMCTSLPAAADSASEAKLAAPLGVRIRATRPEGAASVEAAFAATVAMSYDSTSFAVDSLAGIGSDGSNTSGTFAFTMTAGHLYGPGKHAGSGLTARVGAAVLVDSLGPLKASYLTLPMGQLGFAHAGALAGLDLGVQAGPVLAGRVRYQEPIRWFGLSPMAGAYVNILAAQASVHLEANHAFQGVAGGGNVNFARGLGCVTLDVVDLCADGMVLHFDDVIAGYVGGTLGFNFGRLGQMFVPSVR